MSGKVWTVSFSTTSIIQVHPTRESRKKPYNTVFCFAISFYLCELTLFDLLGCGS